MIPVYQPYLNGREKQYVNQCLDSTWISSKGEFIDKFESSFCSYIGAKNATTVANGTVSIHLALDALGIQAGDEVIVPTFTYVASVNPIVQLGAKPVFVDSIKTTLQVDPKDIKRKITARTKAVMAVHLYGLPCDMDAITAICQEYNLLLIEDCAEAFGSRYRGKHVGTFGNVATFSFFGNKTITTGEGGMVIAKDKQIIEKARHLKSQGVSKSREYWHDCLAYNYRMTNICAAIGLAQLEQADEIIKKKRKIADSYKQLLACLPLEFHSEIPNTTHSFWMCSILTDNGAKRDALRNHLKQAGIDTRPFFPPAHTLPPHLTTEQFPVAKSLSTRGINLPSYPGLSQGQIDDICQQIKCFFT